MGFFIYVSLTSTQETFNYLAHPQYETATWTFSHLHFHRGKNVAVPKYGFLFNRKNSILFFKTKKKKNRKSFSLAFKGAIEAVDAVAAFGYWDLNPGLAHTEHTFFLGCTSLSHSSWYERSQTHLLIMSVSSPLIQTLTSSPYVLL